MTVQMFVLPKTGIVLVKLKTGVALPSRDFHERMQFILCRPIQSELSTEGPSYQWSAMMTIVWSINFPFMTVFY